MKREIIKRIIKEELAAVLGEFNIKEANVASMHKELEEKMAELSAAYGAMMGVNTGYDGTMEFQQAIPALEADIKKLKDEIAKEVSGRMAGTDFGSMFK